MTPAQQMLRDAIDVIGQRRTTYGPPAEHWAMTVSLVNAAFGSVLKTPLTVSDWGLIMLLDKVARWKGPLKTADGPLDMAGYAACIAEVEGYGPARSIQKEMEDFAAQCTRLA
jgi:hypothetical protein